MAEVRAGRRSDGRVDDAAIAEAAAWVSAGRLVAFPTETVYGLGAATFDAAALGHAYALKGRPNDNPLIAHVDAADSGRLARLTPSAGDERVAALAAAFWPGPLTLVLPRAADVPAVAAGGRDTIAVRCPRHPVALALLRALGAPISAPSANVSGHVSPTTAAHVAAEFPAADLLVLDGGPCEVGLESTVLDLTRDPPRILRPGSITADILRTVLGDVDATLVHGQAASPGTRTRHYAPRSPTVRCRARDLAAVIERAATAPGRLVVVGRASDLPAAGIPAPHQLIVLPDDADQYGRQLYAAVREADAIAADANAAASGRLVIIDPCDGTDPAWHAIADRLQRMVAPAEDS